MSTPASTIARRFGIDPRDAKALLRVVEAGSARRRSAAAVLCAILWLVLALVFGWVAGLLLLAIAGPFAAPGGLLIGAAAAGLLVHSIYTSMRSNFAIAAIGRARLRRECLHCGYDLRANLGDTGVPTCPECGEAALHLPAPGPAIPSARHR